MGGSTNSSSTNLPRRAWSPAPHTHPAPEILFKTCSPSYRALRSQSAATRVLWEPLTLAELSAVFSSTRSPILLSFALIT